jgi:hypothetical protein
MEVMAAVVLIDCHFFGEGNILVLRDAIYT